MAIPVHLQSFKAAGIYRVVFDKSTITGVDSRILRLVVGYSEIGPFNEPVYVTSVSDFKAIFGDISKKLEKRGVYFHRIAMQALTTGPILALNLKKFDGETVDGASINTAFNPSFEIIDTVKLNVEDIYDTTRFWKLDAERLNNLVSADGIVLDQYINLCTTNTAKTSATYFIRKATGNAKLNGYNITVSDWYSDKVEEMPEYLYKYKNSKISDFFAEIYVFDGRFTADQVLSSNTLKNYFEIKMENGEPVLDDEGKPVLKLKPYVTNAFGDKIDTLDALYSDFTSNCLGRYIGSLIPYFKNKQGAYVSLDILFNADIDTHHMMMAFNTDMLEELGTANVDLSGRLSIRTSANGDAYALALDNLMAGTVKTSLLGNEEAPVISEVKSFVPSVVKREGDIYVVRNKFATTSKKIYGSLYISGYTNVENNYSITLTQVGNSAQTVTINCVSEEDLNNTLKTLGFTTDKSGFGTYWKGDEAPFIDDAGKLTLYGPQRIITAIVRIEATDANVYDDLDQNMKVTFLDNMLVEEEQVSDSLYDNSISFIPVNETKWSTGEINGAKALISTEISDNSLLNILKTNDCLLADDGSVDADEDMEVDEADGFYDNVFVTGTGTLYNEDGSFKCYYIKVSGDPTIYSANDANGVLTSYLVRVDAPLNQEIGTIVPRYLEGYTYRNSKPAGTSMLDKLNWQDFILSTLTTYKGIRTGLLNKSDIDYRYIVDTFETYVDAEAKSVLSMLAKEKQSAFAILNFPSVKTFIKCPYTSFTDNKGVFKVDYVVEGFNRKKPAGKRFSLPSDANGASFCAFYSPLKFSDGYVETIVPAAGLVSNLFMEKYMSRQPYYIIAGPNYGRINAGGLVGPDYKYSLEELNLIEPYGVNCMIYRPGFGTFINANQTAKQTPVSALSKVNVRELVIFLQDEIEKVLQSYQWEFNNATTRTAILDKANNICARIANNGGIQAYLNIMDESNNTPEIIDNEMAVLSTHIEPGMGCGKMVHELTLYRTGQMAAAISE